MKNCSKNGFSFIEIIVGTAIMLVVFLGLFNAYRLSLKMITQSRSRIIASALANKQIETARNLSYQSVGVIGGFPDGVLDSATTTLSNNILFTIENRVDYVVDPTDGIALPEDECPDDYKKMQTKVFWVAGFGGEVLFATDISPRNIAQECGTGGGILSVSVFDAKGAMVSSPLIEIKNPLTGETVKSATPFSGQYYFSLATSSYKTVISRSGFSGEETYASGDIYGGSVIISPENPNPIVLEGQLAELYFSIDGLASFSVDTVSSWGSGDFSDSFSDGSGISEMSGVALESGDVALISDENGYSPSGFLVSNAILPENLTNWEEFSFTDNEPAETDLKYQIYYASSTDWELIPENDLPGNLSGFDSSPVDLSGLSASVYGSLKLRADFSSGNASVTPALYDWSVSWVNSEMTPIAGARFNLRGDKVVGTDADDKPIYKYDAYSVSDSSGHKNITDLEWDLYTFLVDPDDGLDLIGIEPSPQPIGLSPNEILPVVLLLDSVDSLLLTLEDSITLEPIFSAEINIYNEGLSYDEILYSNEKGQAYFVPLLSAVYTLEISAPGYASAMTTAGVSGRTIKTIRLEQIE